MKKLMLATLVSSVLVGCGSGDDGKQNEAPSGEVPCT